LALTATLSAAPMETAAQTRNSPQQEHVQVGTRHRGRDFGLNSVNWFEIISHNEIRVNLKMSESEGPMFSRQTYNIDGITIRTNRQVGRRGDLQRIINVTRDARERIVPLEVIAERQREQQERTRSHREWVEREANRPPTWVERQRAQENQNRNAFQGSFTLVGSQWVQRYGIISHNQIEILMRNGGEKRTFHMEGIEVTVVGEMPEHSLSEIRRVVLETERARNEMGRHLQQPTIRSSDFQTGGRPRRVLQGSNNIASFYVVAHDKIAVRMVGVGQTGVLQTVQVGGVSFQVLMPSNTQINQRAMQELSQIAELSAVERAQMRQQSQGHGL